MRVVVGSAGQAQDLDVALRTPEATLADLVEAATGAPAPEEVLVGGRPVDAACPVLDAGLHEGAVLGLPDASSAAGAPRRDVRAPGDGPVLVVTGGLQAGLRLPLPLGDTTVGRDADCTVVLPSHRLSRRHVTFVRRSDGPVLVRDEGSSNGTWADGVEVLQDAVPLEPGVVVVAGRDALTVAPDLDDRPRGLDVRRQVGPTGTVPFNRPPREGSLPAPGPVRLPTRRGPAPEAQFSLASMIGPLLLAGITVLVTGDPRFALISALSPVLGIGTYLEQRRRQVREDRSSGREFAAGVAALREQVAQAAVVERTRRRAQCPDPAEALRRAALPSVRLWERRPASPDFLRLHAGLADLPWSPPVDAASSSRPEPEVEAVLQEARLRAAPVEVDLSGGGVVGVVGDRAAAMAVARSLLCQAVAQSGPADLTVGVFVDPGRQADWDWAKWLPHTRRGSTGDRWTSAVRERSEALLRALLPGAETPALLVVLDSDLLTEGKNAPARALLSAGRRPRGPAGERPPQVSGIVLAATEDRLPAACTTVVEVADAATAVVRHPEQRRTVPDVLAAGLPLSRALACARDLARFDDPELVVAGGGLPDGVRLLPLLDLDRVDADSVRRRWAVSAAERRVTAPVGVTESGVLTLDLVRDGPHGLVGGTTGSGKSEFLRSLVAGLAARNDPTRLTFVLIDFKGGAAFDVCSGLPHTVGMVTDLDAQLADRALRALEAELHHRERLFAAAGVSDLSEYTASGPAEPLPRLLLVVDEFAVLAKEHPDVLTALVSIAAVGRTLGVHMLLATQRPAGAVKEDILTNTNLRVALRVQSAQDSVNVLDVPDAAAISRERAGRAYVKLGHDEIVAIQTALVTCVTGQEADTPVEVQPFVFGEPPAPARSTAAASGPTDLQRLVDAVVQAAADAGTPPPRRPWPEPLGTSVRLADVGGLSGDRVLFALADDPDRQAQVPAGWDLADGNLLLLGTPGSGTSTALTSLALVLATGRPTCELELLVLDLGAGALAPLAALPHTAAYVGAGDRERAVRLLRHLRAELERRRRDRGGPRTVVLLDGLGALREDLDDAEGLDLLDQLYRVYADGPALGLSFAVTADRAAAVPSALTSLTSQAWLFRLPDPYDYSSFGLSPRLAPPAVPGRAVLAGSGLQVHVGAPGRPLADVVATVTGPAREPLIGVLPAQVPLAAVGLHAELEGEPWRLPVGLRESDLGGVALALYEGEHALVSGPARSGKSTTLLALATGLRAAAVRAGRPLLLLGAGGRRSPLAGAVELLDGCAGSPAELPALLERARTAPGRVVLLVDDAEAYDDGDGALAGLLAARRPDLHVVAAGRNDALRTLYGHWTRAVRASRTGLLLQPDVDLDGDLLGTVLPRRAPVALTVGRGYLVQDGEPALVQAASPDQPVPPPSGACG